MQASQGQPRVAAQRAVIVHGMRDVTAALALAGGREVALLSAPGVAGYLGLAGFRALFPPEALPCVILDAADAPGHALAALRAGFRRVVLAPGVPGFAAVAALADAMGATLLSAPPEALDLSRVDLEKPQGRLHLARWLDLP